MPQKILIHEKTAKDIRKLDASIKERVKREISTLAKNPKKGKHLKHSNCYSLRIGVYRAVYEIHQNQIIVLYFGHRKNVYSDFSKLL